MQLRDTLLVSVHEQPVLKSRLDKDQWSSLQIPQITVSDLSHKSDPKAIPLSGTKHESTFHHTAATRSLNHSSLFEGPNSHHALEVCVGSHKVTSCKTSPLDPQTTSAKGTIAQADNGFSSSQQAAESIRRLYSLTFKDSQKGQNGELKQEGETEKISEREAGVAKEEAAAVGSSPFQSLRKSFKTSPKRRERDGSRKRSALSESSSESPRHRSNPIVRRKTVSGARMAEKPKFYLRDILPILQERNKLKEQVHLLECEVESLKRCI